ncbi:folate receptor alpha-like isoform X2 [Ruditapes philippinarum]|uniref:folate receptor alpha-like isoform X2 n=1 Tax=Ruditapes philippinarum TaxID=129788 RepID=UPI00295B5F9C|nr:folate receptor alpha-like isoform X2 [Ruditapes philippinarum]
MGLMWTKGKGQLTVYLILQLLQVLGCYGNRLLQFSSPDEYLNICTDGISHKKAPGPESGLFDKCRPWKDRSCCTESLAKDIHVNKTWYKMDWSHCPQQPLSDKCRGRFIQDLCFYECSPNVGPWLVKVSGMKIRKERFVDVPLCQTECDAWWEDCRDDYTCIENWSRQFNWSSGTPQCPLGSTCKKFSEIYKSSSDFCEKVWDHSWKVVNDTTPEGCFVMWWNEGDENPNQQIAYAKARQIVSWASRITTNLSALIYCIICFFFVTMF